MSERLPWMTVIDVRAGHPQESVGTLASSLYLNPVAILQHPPLTQKRTRFIDPLLQMSSCIRNSSAANHPQQRVTQ
jgi:hypothetical protein